ncbi:hypothetical protein BaRGS_00027339 [Batillaria attramentaria]|uniref:Chordin n=1 Tax=Batillaria attramentaria TaxID=370345 RepID=A0ABD0K2V4_9CAEN
MNSRLRRESDFETNFSFRPKSKITGVYSDDQQQFHQVNEFRALLVGKNVRRHPVRTSSVAVIHITVERGELRYSVRYSKLDRPKFLQITDANGNVLFEKPIQKRRKGDKKLCGVWRKIPPIYVQYFRQERLFAVITASKYPDGLVAGRIVPNDMASTEVFGSVLSSPTADGIGGLASFEYDPAKKLVKYVIYVDGMVEAGVGAEYRVTIAKNTRVLHQATANTSPLTTKISGTWKVSKRRQRKQLARGRVRMSVTSQNGAVISGIVQPKLLCGVFQAVLSGSNALEKNEATSAGSAVVELRATNGFDYTIRVVGLESEVTRVRIEGPSSKRKRKLKQRIVGNLHRQFHSDNSSFDGWANGTFKKLEAKDIYNLLNNRLYINIVTARHRISELRGRLIQTPYHEQLETASAPTSLPPTTPEARGAAAHAWLSMDVGCLLHYDAFLAGFRHKNEIEGVGGSFSVLLGSHDNRLQRTIRLGPSSGHVVTSQYEYNISSGSVNDIPEYMFRDLDLGRAFLQIISGPANKAVFKGNVTLPNTCWQYVRDLDTSVAVDEQAVTNQSAANARCYFEGTFYDNGGKVVCHAVRCPKLSCANPVKLDSECCPTCPDESWSETCTLGKDPREYPLGRTWYPFLPLEGFAKCVTCTCKEGSQPVCDRLECPKLNCPGHELIKEPGDCCPVCGPRISDSFDLDRPQLDINMEGACNFMGTWKADGESWHPRVKPFGHMKCFVCNCQAGEFKCGRTECPRLKCKRKIRKPQSCCDECSADRPEEDEETETEKKTKRGCSFGGKSYDHRAKWRPPAAPNGDAMCARCTCKNGRVKCKIRCPKKCAADQNSSPCCRYCQGRVEPAEDRVESDDEKVLSILTASRVVKDGEWTVESIEKDCSSKSSFKSNDTSETESASDKTSSTTTTSSNPPPTKSKKGLTCGKPVNSTQYDHLRGVTSRHDHPHIPEPEVAMIFRKKGSRSSEVDLNDLEEKLLRLKKEKPKSAQVYNQIGNFWRIKGNTQLSIECFRRALSISPDHPDVLLNLARVLFNLQYLDDAIFLTRRSLEMQPSEQNSWLQHYTLGEILKAYGHYQEATLHFRHCLELNPDFQPAIAHLREMEGTPSPSVTQYTLFIILFLVLGVLFGVVTSIEANFEDTGEVVKTQRHFNRAMAMRSIKLGINHRLIRMRKLNC